MRVPAQAVVILTPDETGKLRIAGSQQQIQGTVTVSNFPTNGATQGTLALVLVAIQGVLAALQGVLTTKAVPLPARQSVIRIITGDANKPIVLSENAFAGALASCTVVNLRNLGTADLLVYNVGMESAVHSYPLPAGQGIAGDFRLSDLALMSTAAVKVAVWGGKEAT